MNEHDLDVIGGIAIVPATIRGDKWLKKNTATGKSKADVVIDTQGPAYVRHLVEKARADGTIVIETKV